MQLLNESNFQEETKEGLVVVDFYTDSCPPCKMIAPVLESVTGAKICKIDATQAPNLCADHRVTVVPTLLFFKNGEVVERSVGVVSKDNLQSKIDRLSK